MPRTGPRRVCESDPMPPPPGTFGELGLLSGGAPPSGPGRWVDHPLWHTHFIIAQRPAECNHFFAGDSVQPLVLPPKNRPNIWWKTGHFPHFFGVNIHSGKVGLSSLLFPVSTAEGGGPSGPPRVHLMYLSSRRMTSRTSMGLAIWAFMPQSRARFTSSAKASAVMARMGRSRSPRSRLRITWVAS